jgi:ferredoxin/flavodoxin
MEGESMKGIMCYYSGSGNTKLACQYLQKHIQNIKIELYNIVKRDIPDFTHYDVVGFATFTDYWGVPHYMCSFFEHMNSHPNRYAFVLNTYGAMSGETLRALAGMAISKGFTVLSGHSLHTPENNPSMRLRKMAFDHAPKPKELKQFDAFIRRLGTLFATIQSGSPPTSEKISIGFINTLLTTIVPKMPRTKAKEDFGEQHVEDTRCTECGLCQKVCPYEAIQLAPQPVFDHQKCYGCWACYNHCPQQAIYTPKYHGAGQYATPNEELRHKLS